MRDDRSDQCAGHGVVRAHHPELQDVLEVMASYGDRGRWPAGGDDASAVELSAGRVSSSTDGFSIGSNDMTQLVLGVDRDSTRSPTTSTSDPAVLKVIGSVARTRWNWVSTSASVVGAVGPSDLAVAGGGGIESSR